MFDWITLDNITSILGVLGFVMSFVTWIKEWVTQRINLSGELTSAMFGVDKAVVYVVFENHSRLPVSISKINLIANNARHPCTNTSKWISQNARISGGKTVYEQNEFSTSLPCSIPELGAISTVLLFEDFQQNLLTGSKSLNLEVCTSRGKIVQMKLELPAEHRNRDKIS